MGFFYGFANHARSALLYVCCEIMIFIWWFLCLKQPVIITIFQGYYWQNHSPSSFIVLLNIYMQAKVYFLLFKVLLFVYLLCCCRQIFLFIYLLFIFTVIVSLLYISFCLLSSSRVSFDRSVEKFWCLQQKAYQTLVFLPLTGSFSNKAVVGKSSLEIQSS